LLDKSSGLKLPQLNLERNRASLGIRCRWGIRNAIFHVAKDPDSSEPDKVLGIAMWMPPKPEGEKQSWYDWFEDWKLWANQVKMNLWYGRGGLNVKVCEVLAQLALTTTSKMRARN